MATVRAQFKPPTTCFVSGLLDEVDEPSLLKHFERIDRSVKVRNTIVLRNHQTLRSRRVALVEFETPEDVDKARAVFNYTDLLGSEIILTPYRTGGIKDRITGNVFVKNLPADYKSKELYELFAPYGKIFSCKVKYNTAGTCKGYGYVQFETKEAADKAIAEANGKDVKGTKIEVCAFKAREARSSSINMYNNLFVKCIPKKFTSEQLKGLFAQYGEIISAVVIKQNNETPENKGFGFVCFKKFEDAKVAEEKLKNFSLEGQALYVCKALSREQHKKEIRERRLREFRDCNVYVKVLPDDVNDEKLKKAFEVFGQVLSARVMVERRPGVNPDVPEIKSKGYGFVCFGNKEDAKKAVLEAPKQQILGTNLYVAIAESKEDRMAKFNQMQFMPMPMGYFGPQMYPQQRYHKAPHGAGRPMNRRQYPPREGMYPPYGMPPMMYPGMPGMPHPMGSAPMPSAPYIYPNNMPAQRVEQPAPLPNDKEALGEQLYALVEQKDKENAAKITGMLLEMEVDQIHNIIRNPQQLDKWISEALKVLNTNAAA